MEHGPDLPTPLAEDPLAHVVDERGPLKAKLKRVLPFALVGGSGTVLNLLIMGLMIHLGSNYIVAAVTGAIITICTNFVLQERFVFEDLKHDAKAKRVRFIQAAAFNGTEAAVRLPLLALIVEATPLHPLPAQALLIAVAFVLRFFYQVEVVYRGKSKQKP